MNTTPARKVICTDLVQTPRTDRQVADAVRTLNTKLAKLISWRGIPRTLYTLTATLEDGAIAVRLAEPDRSMTGQPDVIHAEKFLAIHMSAVALYRHGKAVYTEGMGNAIIKQMAESAK